MTKNVEKNKKTDCGEIKVIHIKRNEFIGKIELYTKLFTLSTENPTKYAVYIVKKSNKSFVHMQ